MVYKNKSQPDGRAHWCRKCQTAKQQKRYAAEETPESKAKRARSVYAWKMRQKYGLTLLEIDAMRIAQGNKCSGCQRTFEGRFYPCVDHDHVTMAVRGILCRACNRALGLVYDDADTLARLAEYLRETNTLSKVAA